MGARAQPPRETDEPVGTGANRPCGRLAVALQLHALAGSSPQLAGPAYAVQDALTAGLIAVKHEPPIAVEATVNEHTRRAHARSATLPGERR